MAITYEVKNTGGFIVRLLNNSSLALGVVHIKDADSSLIWEHDFQTHDKSVYIKLPYTDLTSFNLTKLIVTVSVGAEDGTYELPINNNTGYTDKFYAENGSWIYLDCIITL